MRTVCHRKVWGVLIAFAGAKAAWAAETAATLTPEPSAVPSTGSAVGLWSSIAAMAVLGVLIVGKMLRSRNGSSSDARLNGGSARVDPGDIQAATPRGYSSQNVGNDASARPWERQGPALDAGTAAGSQGGYSTIELQSEEAVASVLSGFDVEGFLTASKANFVDLQAAWDRSDTAILRAMMTDSMLEQIKGQLIEREQNTSGAAHASSEIEMLEAHLLGIEEQGDNFIASVEFSGLLREGSSIGPSPFRELWSITRPKEGGGWLVAGVQALQ